MSQQTPAPEATDLSPAGQWNRMYIGGEWVEPDGEDYFHDEDPSTQEEFAAVPAASTDQVDAAFEAAKNAQPEWAALPPQVRISALERVAEHIEDHQKDLIQTLVGEAGSSYTKATGEVQLAGDVLKKAMGLALEVAGETKPSTIPGKENRVERVPVGVVAAITPWNFPFQLAFRDIAPALALGNTVVLKPSPDTPVSGGLAVARIFDAAGVPDGVLNVVTGRDEEIGDHVSGHEVPSVVAYTGSTDVGRHVGKRAIDADASPLLELGGNAPAVVLDDVDPGDIMDAVVNGTFFHQGQVCISINRHIVHESIYDDYVARLVDRAEDLPVGSAHEPSNLVGPVINPRRRDEILEYVEETVEAGATLETGGTADGNVVEPTVLSDVTNDMTAACNEHFGPVAPVIPYSDEEEAIAIANDTDHGLSSAVFAADQARGEEVAKQIEAGMVHVNDMPINLEPHVPFGGIKASGIGYHEGSAVIDEFTHRKWISVQKGDRPYFM